MRLFWNDAKIISSKHMGFLSAGASWELWRSLLLSVTLDSWGWAPKTMTFETVLLRTGHLYFVLYYKIRLWMVKLHFEALLYTHVIYSVSVCLCARGRDRVGGRIYCVSVTSSVQGPALHTIGCFPLIHHCVWGHPMRHTLLMSRWSL